MQLTKVMVLELARYNIQVNALAPGYTEDELKGAALCLASPASSFTKVLPRR